MHPLSPIEPPGGKPGRKQQGAFYMRKRPNDRERTMFDFDDLYSPVSFCGGGDGGEGGGPDIGAGNVARGHGRTGANGRSRSNRGRNELSQDGGYGRPAPGDLNGDGDGWDEAAIGLGVIGIAATLGGATPAVSVGIGVAGLGASVADRGR